MDEQNPWNMIRTAIATNVRTLRRQRGWSVATLAQRCEAVGASQLTEASLGNIERGQDPRAVRPAREVSAADLFVFAHVFDVPLSALTGSRCAVCADNPPAGFTCNACSASSSLRP